MTVYIKNLKDDNVEIVSNTDSLDFSEVRELKVMSNSGKFLRTYKVKVNVHKEQADSFFWAPMTKNTDIEQLQNVKTCAIKTAESKDRLFLFGTDGNNTKLYVMNNGQNWTAATPKLNDADLTFDANVCKSIVTKNEKVYICNAATSYAPLTATHGNRPATLLPSRHS